MKAARRADAAREREVAARIETTRRQVSNSSREEFAA
jgi:hypothetical protein